MAKRRLSANAVSSRSPRLFLTLITKMGSPTGVPTLVCEPLATVLALIESEVERIWRMSSVRAAISVFWGRLASASTWRIMMFSACLTSLDSNPFCALCQATMSAHGSTYCDRAGL